jgi:hypothetical protein
MSTYKVEVEPAKIREEKIAALTAASTETEPFYEYQNGRHDLKIITVPLNLPLYRMANFRTRTAQQAYIRREGKPADLFSAGEENETAQQRQHELLLKFANEGREGSITPIIKVLKTEKQRQPILITSRGVVVNGNRRLAGMRDLYTEGGHSEFSHVRCQVLPPTATNDEIVEVEVRLQMKQRTELDYDWINECIAVRELKESKKTDKELMALMNKKKADIYAALNALTEADLYLTEWLNRPGDYETIEDAEQFFYDMGENVSSKTGEAQEVSRRIAWLLADRRKLLKRRVYDFKPMFGKRSDEVVAKMAERFGVELESDAGLPDDGEDFAVDIDATPGPTLRPLIDLLGDPARRDELGSELVDVCEGIIEIDRGNKDRQLPLMMVQTANTKLSEIDMTRASPDSFDAIDKQLDAIQSHVDRLRAAIERQRNANTSDVS